MNSLSHVINEETRYAKMLRLSMEHFVARPVYHSDFFIESVASLL